MRIEASAPETTGPPEIVALGGRQTLSQLVAKILDQLSISAWLPAGVLILLALVAGSLRAADGEVGKAVSSMGDLSAASLVLLFVTIIMATVLTQAFQFEAIRLLEGYWGTGKLRSALTDVRCNRYIAKREAIWDRLKAVEDAAFDRAVLAMLADGVSAKTVDLVQRVYAGQVQARQLSKKQRDKIARHPWEEYAPAAALRQRDALAAAARRFPEQDHAVRPTRLGNTLRSYEDPIEANLRGPIEGFVQEVFHRLPASLQSEHDQLRSRLDLYCSLVVVFVLSGVVGVGLLADVNDLESAGAGVLAVALGWLSYRAAITSARYYGTLLGTIAELAMEDA
jgi:hypothetical protein